MLIIKYNTMYNFSSIQNVLEHIHQYTDSDYPKEILIKPSDINTTVAWLNRIRQTKVNFKSNSILRIKPPPFFNHIFLYYYNEKRKKNKLTVFLFYDIIEQEGDFPLLPAAPPTSGKAGKLPYAGVCIIKSQCTFGALLILAYNISGGYE